MKYLRYLWYIIKHKYYVIQACQDMGCPEVGIFHDWSKFLPSEFFPFANHFGIKQSAKLRDKTGYYKPTDTGDPEFDFAWFLHQKRNKHHWQYWVLPIEYSGVKVLEIPDLYIKEMYCDWIGASLAQGYGGITGVVKWYEANKDKLQLGEITREKIEELVYSGGNQ